MMPPATSAERASIIDALASSDEEVRRLAAERLLALPIEDAAAQLFECLGDRSWRVRKAAVEGLVTCGGETQVQEMLISSLADGENSGRRNSAFEALVGCGRRATGRLISEISSADVDVRKLVIDALAAIGDPVARDPLVDATEDSDPNVRAAAVEALGIVGGRDEITHLVKVSSQCDEDVIVRISALRALSQMEADVGVAELLDALGNSLLCPAALELLGYSEDDDATRTLLKGLSEAGRSSQESAMAALLRRFGQVDDQDSEEFMIQLRGTVQANDGLVRRCCGRLETADLASRMMLIQFLGLLDDPETVLSILGAGRDEAISELADATLESMGDLVPTALGPVWDDLDSRLKARACTIFGRVGGVASDQMLVQCLTAADGEIRCRAASALGEGEYVDRVPELARQLEVASLVGECEAEEEIFTVIAAISRLAESPRAEETGGDARLIESLTSRLEGAPEPVRLAMAQVLARLGRDLDRDVIRDLLRDESAEVRRAAVGALGRFDFSDCRDALRLSLADESMRVRISAARVLGESGSSEAIGELRRLVVDEEDPKVVAVAIRSIGHLSGADGVDPGEVADLIGEAIRSEPIVAFAGLDALSEVGGDRAGSMALSALGRQEPDVVRAAVACVGAHGGETDLMELIAQIGHVDWSVRAEIAKVLSERGVRRGLPALLRRLEVEDDAFVREVMLRSIGRLEG